MKLTFIPTHAMIGALLVAVGQHMIDTDVCAEAVLAPDMLADEDYARTLATAVRQAEHYCDLEMEQALELINGITLAEAVEFVHPSFLKGFEANG